MGRKVFLISSVLMILCGLFQGVASAERDVEVLVTQGDKLINICRKYLDDPEEWPEVAAVNQLGNPHLILPGQKLIIPAALLKGIPSQGKATFIKGLAEIQGKYEETWRPLKIEDSVAEGSRLRTGSDSALEITFEDGSSLFMRSETSAGMSKVRKRGGVNLIRELFLQGGRIITHIRKSTGREQRFQILTPSATAAARGTDFRVSHDTKESTRVEVLKGTVTAKARRRKIELEEGEGTLVRKGQDPKPPSRLLGPAGLINPEPLYRKMPLEFRFDRVEGAVAYRVMLAKDQDFKDLIRERVIMPAETLKVEPVDDGSYYMQVLSIDRFGLEGLPSEAHPVKVRTNPIPPFAQSPVDGTEYKTVTMEFAWLQVKDAVKYQMQIAEDADFIKVVDEKDLVKTTAYKTKALHPRTYYFRIRSIAGDGYVGIWSDAIKFSLLKPPPAPASEPPRKGKKEISIRWNDLGEGFSYHFQMARDEDFNEMVIDQRVGASQYSFPRPKKAGIYYVRVSAIQPDGFEGHFCVPQSFKTGCMPFP